MAFSGAINAATYYIDATNGNDNNSGLSAATPWMTLQMVKTNSFMPGDSILLKRGEVWHERLSINSSGNGFAFITLGAYGSGNKPVINVVTEQNRYWVSAGDNRWEITLSYNPRRVLKDGVEILGASYGNPQELGTHVPDLVEWYYDYDNQTLTLFSTDSPTSHLIEFSSDLYALNIAAEHYLKIENIEFIGGYNYCTAFSSCSNLQLKNLQIGAYANSGLYLSYYKVSGDTFQFNRNIGIDSCIIDSKYDFDYGQAPITSYVTVRGPREGVIFRGTFNSELKNCLIKDYCHANINIFASIDSLGNPVEGAVVTGNKIHHNTITSPDIAYGGRVAIDGYCYNNEIYDNLITNTATQTQLNGFNNHIHHNIFKETKSSTLKSYSNGYGISVQAYYDSVRNNIFENNLMIDCDNAGILVSGNNSAGVVRNNIFRNNIIYNCGAVEGNSGIYVFPQINTYLNDGNIFENNLVYNTTTSTTINFYDTLMTVEEFNNHNGINGHIITDNLSVEPLFVDLQGGDYHQQVSSPTIDQGAATLATLDYEGNPIPYGAAPDIGIFEHQEFVGVSSKRQPNFILYPNPVRETTMLYLKKQYKQVTVSITTMSGKEIFFEKRNHVSKIPLTLKGSSGLYLVSVCADDGYTRTLKLVKR